MLIKIIIFVMGLYVNSQLVWAEARVNSIEIGLGHEGFDIDYDVEYGSDNPTISNTKITLESFGGFADGIYPLVNRPFYEVNIEFDDGEILKGYFLISAAGFFEDLGLGKVKVEGFGYQQLIIDQAIRQIIDKTGQKYNKKIHEFNLMAMDISAMLTKNWFINGRLNLGNRVQGFDGQVRYFYKKLSVGLNFNKTFLDVENEIEPNAKDQWIDTEIYRFDATYAIDKNWNVQLFSETGDVDSYDPNIDEYIDDEEGEFTRTGIELKYLFLPGKD